MKRQSLLKALEIVKPGLANKELISQSTSFAFIKGRVLTYNNEVSISHPVPELKIEGAIRAEELYKLLSKLEQDEVELECSESEIILKSGKVSAGLTLQSEIKLPLEEIGEHEKWKTLPDGFIKALKFCMFSCSKDMSRPVLTCVNVRKDGIVESTDNFRVTRYQQKEAMPTNTFLTPVSSIRELVKYPIVKIAEGRGWVHFKTEEKTLFSCRIFEDRFPDTSPILEVKGKEIVLPKSIGESLDRASVFSKQEQFLNESIKITLSDEQMKICAKMDGAWFEETSHIKYREDPITFSINPTFLKEIVEQAGTCILGENQVKFTGNNWEHVIALQRN